MMRRLVPAVVAGVFLFAGVAFSHVTVQKGPLLPDSTAQLQSDFGRDHRDLEPSVLAIRLTTAGLNYLESLINGALQDTLLVDYVDCLVRGALDADTGNGTDEVTWDTNTNTCSVANYDAGALLGPTCLSVPVLGNFCLFILVDDIDGNGHIIDFTVDTGLGLPGINLVPQTNNNKILRYASENDPAHDTDDTLDVQIVLANLTIDAIFTYPNDVNLYGYDASVDTCSSTLEDGPACLGDATCGETDAGDYYDPVTDLSNYPTVWAKLLLGCYDTGLADAGSVLANELCPGVNGPLMIALSARGGMSYDDKTHINYDAADGSPDSGAWCDPDRDPDGDISGGQGCHLKALDVNVSKLTLAANAYIKFDMNPNRVCPTCPNNQVWGDRVGTSTEFTGADPCCGAANNDCSTLTSAQKAYCDRNANDVCNDLYDDPNYNPTQNIAGMIPFIEAQILAKMEDVFTCECLYGTYPGGQDGDICTPDADECIDPVTGQSRAGTLNTCGDENYPPDDPGCVGYYLASTLRMNLSPTLDTLSFDNPLTPDTEQIYIDAGVRADFWADNVGVLLPGDIGLDLYYTWDGAAGSAVNLEPMTSCVTLQLQDAGITTVNPVVSQVCYDDRYYDFTPVGYTCGVTEYVTGVQGADAGPFNTELAPVEFKATSFAGSATTGTFTYHIGLGIHHNVFSRVITSAIKSGILCTTIDQNTLSSLLGGLGGGAAGGIASAITSVLNTDTFGLLMPKLQELYPGAPMQIRIVPSFKRPEPADYGANFEAAYPPATTGPLAPLSSGAVDVPFILTGGRSVAYIIPDYPNYPGTLTTATADLTIGIPHIRLDFHVDTGGGTYNRVFGLDVGALLGIDIELLRDDSRFITRPFPGIGNMVTGRILHLGVMASSGVNYYLEYYEALTGLSRKDLNGILSNLLPVILSSVIGIQADVGFDIAALLPVPLSFRTVQDSVCTGPTGNQTCPAAYIGPIGPARAYMPGASITWDQPLRILEGANAQTVTIRPTDLNSINPPDWLGVALQLYGQMNAQFIINLLEGGTLSGLLGGLPFGSPVDYSDGFNPPETKIIAAEKLSAMNASFWFDADDDLDTGDTVRYAWRLDGGLWTPFTNIRSLQFHHLWEGTHVLEVRAVDSDFNMDPTPARYVFRIDSLGPSIKIHGLGDMNIVATTSPTFYVEAHDAQAPESAITISYRVDGGEWTPFTSARTITLSDLTDGLHRLEVRAKDDVGNISTASVTFKVAPSAQGFGCSTVKAHGTGLLFLALLIIPVLLRRTH